MNKYENGQIYKVVSPDFSKCYIGSTTEGIKKRLIRHKAAYNSIKRYNKKLDNTCFQLFDEYGVENCKIYWIEDWHCQSKKELEAREGYWIETTECVNRCIAGRSNEQWRRDHIEEKKAYDKKRREEKKEEISAREKEPYNCPCGCIIQRTEKARHCKSKKHQDWSKQQEEQLEKI